MFPIVALLAASSMTTNVALAAAAGNDRGNMPNNVTIMPGSSSIVSSSLSGDSKSGVSLSGASFTGAGLSGAGAAFNIYSGFKDDGTVDPFLATRLSEQMQFNADKLTLDSFNALPKSRISKMREAYQKAAKAFKKGDEVQGIKIQNEELQGYPLNIWLTYYYLAYNIRTDKFEAMMNFVRDNKHSELSKLLKDRYIKFLSDEKDYARLSLLIGDKPFDETRLSSLSFTQKSELCRYYEANWPLNKVSSEAISFATRIYLDLKSRPLSCRPLMSYFDKQGYLTNKLIFKRFESAYISRSYGDTTEELSSVLERKKDYKKRVAAQMAFYQDPELIFAMTIPSEEQYQKLLEKKAQEQKAAAKKAHNTKQTAQNSKKKNEAPDPKAVAKAALAELDPDTAHRVVVLAFQRYANLSPQAARNNLDRFIKKFEPSATEMVGIYQTFAQSFLGRNYQLSDVTWVDKNLPALAWTMELREQRLRRAIYFGQWEEAYVLINHLPNDMQQNVNWRYWKGRAALELGHKKEGQELLAEVAKDRSFFGFYAAQTLGKEYPFNYLKIDSKFSFPMDVANNKSALRFLELFAIDDDNAIYEWRELAKKSPEHEAMVMAQWALQTGNIRYAIDFVVTSKRWDALDYRFPIAYRDFYEHFALESGVPISFLYGISRQESMLNHKIKSWAGAMGLMQVMPGTAKDIAKRNKWVLAKTNDLLDPETNIKYGSTYLSWMLNKFDHNRILAAAAYNAGPGRIPQWSSKDGVERDAAMYVECIPFEETRQYVQNVLLYDAIYNFLLTGKSADLISPNELSYRY